jgi:hypothetical protein
LAATFFLPNRLLLGATPKLMIRLFVSQCKTILERLTINEPDESLFQTSTCAYNPYTGTCPKCGVQGKLSAYGEYARFLVSIVKTQSKESRIKPLRFKCTQCRSTHALLPDIIVPYSPYSLRFIISFLIAYFERETTVAALCERYGVAVSTLYRWKKRLLSHKSLLLGAMRDREETAPVFIHTLLSRMEILSAQIRKFFQTHGFSFMQQNICGTSQTKPP